MGITIIAVLIVCWYTTLNGELNDDSLYYIGVVNTTVTTDTMFQYNAYTGVAMPSHYFRRVLVTFEINAAVVCRILGGTSNHYHEDIQRKSECHIDSTHDCIDWNNCFL